MRSLEAHGEDRREAHEEGQVEGPERTEVAAGPARGRAAPTCRSSSSAAPRPAAIRKSRRESPSSVKWKGEPSYQRSL